MSRRLQAVERLSPPPLNSRREIDDWAAERWQTLSALLEAERRRFAGESHGTGEQTQLEFGEAA